MTKKTEKQERQGLSNEAEILSATETAQAHASHEPSFQQPNSDARTDLPNRQRRDAKAGASPSLHEVKARIVAARGRGPSRPLDALVAAEADLHARSAALARLSTPTKKRPDTDLLIHQLTTTVDTRNAGMKLAPKLRNDAVALYSALQSSDPVASIFDRLLVSMTITVMACHARAARTGDPKAIDVNLRHAVKGTAVIIDLVDARTRRRSSPKNITVGNVNVKAGGQAIVGNVVTPKNRSENKTRTDASLDTDSSLDNDEETGD